MGARSDVFSTEKRSAVMRRVKGRDTGPERVVRRLLRGLGVGYRLNRADLPGRPDIVMAGRRLAIFVHGCFWHGHDCRRGAREPKANADYWRAKIARNRARDVAVTDQLRALGWRVDVVWECDLADRAALTQRLALLTARPVTKDQAAPLRAGSRGSAEAPASSTAPNAPSRAAGVSGLETK